jgi:hypothetical protein
MLSRASATILGAPRLRNEWPGLSYQYLPKYITGNPRLAHMARVA